MNTSNAPKGRLTIFHLWWLLAAPTALFCGIGFGAVRFGWVGGILGGVVGLVLGVIVGWLPWFLAFMFLSHLGSWRQPTDKNET